MSSFSIWPHHAFAPWWASLASLPKASDYQTMCDGVHISPQRSSTGLPTRALWISQHEYSSLNISVWIRISINCTACKDKKRGTCFFRGWTACTEQRTGDCYTVVVFIVFQLTFKTFIQRILSWCSKAPLRFLLTLWCYINYRIIIIIIIIILIIIIDRNAWTHLFTRLVVLGGDKQSSCRYLRRHTRNFLFISKGLSFNTALQSDCFQRHLDRWEWYRRSTTPDLILT